MDKVRDEHEDSGPGSIVARADALMQRRRQSAPPYPGEPEDLPVLTEVVDAESGLPLSREDPASPAFDPAVLDILAHELSRRMRERLAADLPGLVEAALQSTLAGLGREIEEGLAQTTEAAIREFLIEREKLAKLQQQR